MAARVGWGRFLAKIHSRLSSGQKWLAMGSEGQAEEGRGCRRFIPEAQHRIGSQEMPTCLVWTPICEYWGAANHP